MKRIPFIYVTVLAGFVAGALIVARVSSNRDARELDPPQGVAPVLGSADVEFDSFTDLVKLSSAALVGEVQSVSKPQWNLPPGEVYDIKDEFPLPVVYQTVTIEAERWIFNDGDFPQTVTLVIPGGSIDRAISAEEAEAINAEAGEKIAAAGDIVTLNEPANSGLVFRPGEPVALLLSRYRFRWADGSDEIVPIVTGFGAGKYHVRDSGQLVNPVAQEHRNIDPPETLQEFERIIRRMQQ